MTNAACTIKVQDKNYRKYILLKYFKHFPVINLNSQDLYSFRLTYIYIYMGHFHNIGPRIVQSLKVF